MRLCRDCWREAVRRFTWIIAACIPAGLVDEMVSTPPPGLQECRQVIFPQLPGRPALQPDSLAWNDKVRSRKPGGCYKTWSEIHQGWLPDAAKFFSPTKSLRNLLPGAGWIYGTFSCRDRCRGDPAVYSACFSRPGHRGPGRYAAVYIDALPPHWDLLLRPVALSQRLRLRLPDKLRSEGVCGIQDIYD